MKSAHRLLLFAMAVLTPALAAETRMFTDKTGRTLKAELVAVQGSAVTLKRADGATFTVQADTFCQTDMLYFEQHGLKAASKDPAPLGSVIIEALIDGPSELRVKKDGIYWINGENAKPGRHEGQEEPTYVDGKSWRPNWKNQRADRGVDRTATKSVEGLDPTKVRFKLLSVTMTRDGVGIEKRDEITANLLQDEFSIRIPDSQTGSRWYKLALKKLP
ncbi:MAG: SHD1 domain-containing protein [Roseimicrobium sp.]